MRHKAALVRCLSTITGWLFVQGVFSLGPALAAAENRYRSETRWSMIESGTRKAGMIARGKAVIATEVGVVKKSWVGGVVVTPRPTATARSARPNRFQAIAQRRAPGRRSMRATNGAGT